jgi:signal transduction histidine kinase
VDAGIRSIRAVTNDLRPSLLDDLGLLPALRSLAAEFAERSGIATDLSAPSALPSLSKDAELALFRALQEGLTNVSRHAGAHRVQIGIAVAEGAVALELSDDGRGLPAGAGPGFGRNGHMGLAGMQERIGALGGTVLVERADGGGVRLAVRLPLGAGIVP